MVFNNYSKLSMISIEKIKRIPFSRNGFYQSDFFVSFSDSKSRISIFANQPIYANEDRNGFELIDFELREILSYRNLKVNQIKFLDINPYRSDLARKVEWELENLKFS